MRVFAFPLLAFVMVSVLVAPDASAKRKKDKGPVVTEEPVLESDKADAQQNAVLLPVITDGPGVDYFAYYKQKTFDAWIDENGNLIFRLKDAKGEYVSDELVVSCPLTTFWYKPVGHNPDGSLRFRGITRWPLDYGKKPLKPMPRAPSTLRIMANLMDGVKLTRQYKVISGGAGIEVSTGFKCENGPHYHSQHQESIIFEKCMTFESSVEFEDRVKALEGYDVIIKGMVEGRKRRQTFPYWDNKQMIAPATDIELVGPWKERRFIIQTKKAPTMYPRIYAGLTPNDGFSVGIHGFDNDTLSIGKHHRVAFLVK